MLRISKYTNLTRTPAAGPYGRTGPGRRFAFKFTRYQLTSRPSHPSRPNRDPTADLWPPGKTGPGGHRGALQMMDLIRAGQRRRPGGSGPPGSRHLRRRRRWAAWSSACPVVCIIVSIVAFVSMICKWDNKKDVSGSLGYLLGYQWRNQDILYGYLSWI